MAASTVDRPTTLLLAVGGATLLLAAALALLPEAPAALLAALAGLAGLALLALFAIDPRRMVLLLLLLRASGDPLLDGLKTPAGGMGLGAALNVVMLLIACRYALRQPGPLMRTVLPLWTPFLLAGLASVAGAPDQGATLRLLLVQLSYGAAFALPLWLVRSEAERTRCLLVLLLSSLLPVAWAVVELAQGGDAQEDGLNRIQATFSHPNIFAFYLMLMITLILYLQKAVAAPLPPRWRWPLWLYMVLLLGLLAATRTRSAWAGCLLIFVIYGAAVERRYLLYALLAPALLLLDDGVRARLLDVAGEDAAADGQLNSYAWRQLLWHAGLAWMDRGHVLFGYGLDAFKYYSPRFFPLPGRDNWDPHNVYVQLYFETGIVGLIGYAWLFGGLLLRLWRRTAGPARALACAAVLAYLLTCYSDNMLYYLSYNWYFWFFAGVVVARVRIPEPHPPC